MQAGYGVEEGWMSRVNTLLDQVITARVQAPCGRGYRVISDASLLLFVLACGSRHWRGESRPWHRKVRPCRVCSIICYNTYSSSHGYSSHVYSSTQARVSEHMPPCHRTRANAAPGCQQLERGCFSPAPVGRDQAFAITDVLPGHPPEPAEHPSICAAWGAWSTGSA